MNERQRLLNGRFKSSNVGITAAKSRVFIACSGAVDNCRCEALSGELDVYMLLVTAFGTSASDWVL